MIESLISLPLYLQWGIIITAGVLYGSLIGLIPSAGPAKALILLFGLVQLFDIPGAEYLFVLFAIAVMVSCSIGDSFASVLIGIPGADGTAATMVDGFPLAKQGKASYALSAAITTSTLGGLLFGVVGFSLFPMYNLISDYISVPEIFGMIVLSFSLITLITTRYAIRCLIALAFGLFVGLIGYDMYSTPRWTGGWEYLVDGVSIVIVTAGLFAMPELLEVLRNKNEYSKIDKKHHNQQTWQGIKDTFKHWWIAFQGSLIGFIVGVLPGTGGGIGDWSAYTATTAISKKEKIPFGKGNIKGVIGSEGANNSGKAGALLPAFLFGIPGNRGVAIIMALFMYVGFEMGTVALVEDQQFIDHLYWGYMLGTAIAGIVLLLFARQVSKIVYLKPIYWVPVMAGLTIWSVLAANYYVTWWEDLTLLIFFSILGYYMKKYEFSRPAFLIAYFLAERLEGSFFQIQQLYFMDGNYINNPIWSMHPIMTGCLIFALMILIYGIKRDKSLTTYS